MQATIEQSRKSFTYQEKVDNLKYRPFAYEKYKDYETKLTKAALVDYLLAQVAIMEGEKTDDLTECQRELGALGDTITRITGKASDLQAKSSAVRTEEEVSRAKVDDLKRQKDSLSEHGLTWKAQVDDLKLLIQAMDEQKNKDVRQGDKKNLEEVVKMMNAPDLTMSYVMDSITQIVTNKMNATFKDEGHKFFTEENYASEIRKCKPELLDKDDLKRIALRINVDAEGQPGDVQKNMTQVDDPAKYVALFPHFKVLFKLVQMGLSKKRMANLQRKLDANDKEVAAVDRAIETETSVIENLRYHHMMAQEGQRLRDHEVNFLNGKKMSLEQRISDLQTKNVLNEAMN